MIEHAFNRRHDLAICLALAAGVLAVYGQVRRHEFLYYDDHEYVTENYYVKAGLTPASVAWAFTTGHIGNWHPLTWLSHMLDSQLYGLDPAGHHLSSVLLHIANTIVLFLVLRRMTGATWQCAFVAAVFAVHPLHAESVAWVAERKDVLSALFWLLTMGAYVRYTERPGITRYLMVAGLLTLGLMAKPMLVTLPFILVLLDYWPLGRLEAVGQGGDKRLAGRARLVVEKLPLFTIAAASSTVTFLVQRASDAVAPLDRFPVWQRCTNALAAYVQYIGKTLWPRHLTAFYPHPEAGLAFWQVAGATLLLLATTLLVVYWGRRRPYLAVGWFWYLGTLVPVIGFVQVGGQALADRYTYIPMTGLAIMAAWGIPELLRPWRHRRTGLSLLAVGVLVALSVAGWRQVSHWRNTETLFAHMLSVRPNDPTAHNILGLTVYKRGKLDEAIGHFSETLRVNPKHVEAHTNLGAALADQGRLDEAIAHYLSALRLNPDYADAHNNLGNARLLQGKVVESMGHYAEALRIDPTHGDALNGMGAALMLQGRLEEAITHLSDALRIRPQDPQLHHNLSLALAGRGRIDEAMTHCAEALRLKPGYEEAQAFWQVLQSQQDAAGPASTKATSQ